MKEEQQVVLALNGKSDQSADLHICVQLELLIKGEHKHKQKEEEHKNRATVCERVLHSFTY